MADQPPIWFQGDNSLQMQLLQQVAYRAQIKVPKSSGYRQHDSSNAGLLLSHWKRTKRNIWNRLASFADVTGINGYSHLPSSPKRAWQVIQKVWANQCIRLFQAECIAIGLLNIRAKPLHYGEIYLLGITMNKPLFTSLRKKDRYLFSIQNANVYYPFFLLVILSQAVYHPYRS